MNKPNSDKPTQLFLSLIRDTLPAAFDSGISPLPHSAAVSHCALWLQSGHIIISGQQVKAGQGIYCDINDTITSASSAVMLRFVVSTNPLSESNTRTNPAAQSQVVFTQATNVTPTECLIRLDQVDFPPAATAYKHTHPGPGIRYLVKGGLTLLSDHDEQKIAPTEAWFEQENHPVMATAIENSSSCFVRTMLLPLEYEGRSTFTLYDPADTNKPTLQTNIRHFEKRIRVSDSH